MPNSIVKFPISKLPVVCLGPIFDHVDFEELLKLLHANRFFRQQSFHRGPTLIESMTISFKFKAAGQNRIFPDSESLEIELYLQEHTGPRYSVDIFKNKSIFRNLRHCGSFHWQLYLGYVLCPQKAEKMEEFAKKLSNCFPRLQSVSSINSFKYEKCKDIFNGFRFQVIGRMSEIRFGGASREEVMQILVRRFAYCKELRINTYTTVRPVTLALLIGRILKMNLWDYKEGGIYELIIEILKNGLPNSETRFLFCCPGFHTLFEKDLEKVHEILSQMPGIVEDPAIVEGQKTVEFLKKQGHGFNAKGFRLPLTKDADLEICYVHYGNLLHYIELAFKEMKD